MKRILSALVFVIVLCGVMDLALYEFASPVHSQGVRTAFRIRSVSSLPSTCLFNVSSVVDVIYKTGAGAGYYTCNANGVSWDGPYPTSGGGAGTVTSVSVTTQNGVSATVTNPTTTPALAFTLGAITPTTVNGNTFTTGTYTLTGAASKILTFNNSLTLAGTDSTTMTFPSTSATIARTDAAQSFTGVQTFNTPIAVGSGGTGLGSGTSGGVLGFTGSTTLASSVALNANILVKGGGAGATPTNSSITDDGTNVSTAENLILTGGASFHRTATAISYTTLASDRFIGVTSTSAARTITLITCPRDGFTQVVKDESGAAGTNNITVVGTTGTIDGLANKVINSNFGSIAVYCVSASGNWFTY